MRASRIFTLLLVTALLAVGGTTPSAQAAGSGATLTLATATPGGLHPDLCTTCLSSGGPTVFLASNSYLGSVPATVAFTSPTGSPVSGIQLQYRAAPGGLYVPSGAAANWQPLVNYTPTELSSQPYQTGLSYASFSGIASGWYQIQAVVTTADGQSYSSNPVRVVVDDDTAQDATGTQFYGTYIGLQNLPAAVSGTIPLVAACEQGGNGGQICPQLGSSSPWSPAAMTFWIAPTNGGSDGTWTPIGTATPEYKSDGVTPVLDSSGMQEFASNSGFDTVTASTPDGTYDVTATASDSPPDANTYMAAPLAVTIDNTPPTVTLANPGPLSGTAGLTASASVKQADAALGVGIAAVTFYYAPAGSGAWTRIGVSTAAPYSKSFPTQSLPNGRYDLEAVATDSAGNTATAVVSNIAINNSVSGPFSASALKISTTTAPAANVSLLGEVASGPDQGTWAYGTTTAPPPTVGGNPLYQYPVTPGAQQLVVLHRRGSGGWQVVAALNSPGGSPFPAKAKVTGEITASGQAWIVVTDGANPAVFYHPRGGGFTYDPVDTGALTPLLTGPSITQKPPALSLGESGSGSAPSEFGTLVSQGQRAQSGQTGGVSIREQLQYGQLSPANCVPGQPLLTGQTSCWAVVQAQPPSGYAPSAGDTLTLASFSPTGLAAGTVTGWGAFDTDDTNNPEPLMLSQLGAGGWGPSIGTKLDPLDLTANFTGSAIQVHPTGVLPASDGVWIEATLSGPSLTPASGSSAYANVIALYDPNTQRVTAAWCTPAVLSYESYACDGVLDANHPGTLPDAVFSTGSGTVAVGLANGFLDVYSNGTWSQTAAPGFVSGSGAALFSDATDGWLAGPNAVGQVSAQVASAPLAQWPDANQSTLTSLALPPAGAGIGVSGALAVGLDGAALHYDATNGWLVDGVPAKAQGHNLLGVAYDGPSRAFAVGAYGTILDWNGNSWSSDPQSSLLTQSQLTAVAFGSGGQGWTVGNLGTILHFDGTAWSAEQLDAADSGENLSSVAVSGSTAFAVAGGNLVERGSSGSWQRVPVCGAGGGSGCLPAGVQGSLTLVSGLPDGGAVVAGQSIMLVRQSGSANFQPSPQPIEGTAVALSAFRDQTTGQVRAFVSVAPPVQTASGYYLPTAGYPAGDGELLVQTGTGWQDLSQAQNPAQAQAGRGQEGQEPDPVLAVAAGQGGNSAWAVGGYAGTQSASGLGTTAPLPQRTTDWQTSSIWRYDAGGAAQPPTLSQAQASLPAQANTVSFAFFSDSECNVECASVSDPQAMVNLSAAAGEIAQFSGQPGGPSFAVLGGNAVGPSDASAFSSGTLGAADFSNLSQYLSPLQGVPLYAAYGQLDAVPSETDPAQSWNSVFQGGPAPFGSGAAPGNITPVSSGGLDGGVHHYYDYDVAQNGGTLRVIVLDNSAGSLDTSASGQSAWLSAQLSAGQAAGVPMVVIAAEPLDSGLASSQPPSVLQGPAGDADAVATELANAGVLAVFTSSPTQSDGVHMIPYQQPGAPPSNQVQIPEYEGGAVGYQQSQNHGVLWYLVSVNTVAGTLKVQGIPVVQSLALEPLSGLTAPRSSTLSFAAVGRRPAGSLLPGDTPEGIANYVTIPCNSCGSVPPSYSFVSSDPLVGNFVKPSGPGSQRPLISGGKTVPSSSSGLFCAYNPGTTTVSVTSGLLTSSLTVTVKPGAIGQPCGYVPDANAANVVVVPGKTIQSSTAGQGGSPSGAAQPVAKTNVVSKVQKISVPPPAPAAAKVVKQPPPAPVHHPHQSHPAPAPQQQPPFIPAASAALAVTPAIVVPIPPPITPVPPGGATAQAQSTAKREEKARKHASQSAYVTRPAGTSADDWFYPAVGVMSLLALFLISSGIRAGANPKLALAENRVTPDPRTRRPRRR